MNGYRKRASGDGGFSDRRRSAIARMGRLRVGTLILIRWIAVGGQAVAVLTVQYGMGYDLPLFACFAAIAVSALSNAWLASRRAPRARLGDPEAALVLGFDLLQLAVLLFLTGGLHNPFSILILAPVTVSATILSRNATAALVALAIAVISVLALWHMPLPWNPPGTFTHPTPYVLGLWTGLSVAAVFVSAYVWSVAEEARSMSEAFAETRQALAREQRFAAVGGLAAAAAHELGSPLATIAVVAGELARSIPPESELAEDVDLLISQSNRCRDILAELSRHPGEMGGMPFERSPLSALVEEAAKPHAADRENILLDVDRDPRDDSPEPDIAHSPEILLAIGTLVQNAMQFARAKVEVTISWSADEAEVSILDDGPGFPPDVLATIGEPYVSSRGSEEGHMGLGIFIAQTLLERTGASISFGNEDGAQVVIRWPRAMLEAIMQDDSGD
jgi:two-component system sensor histidine kinase RegB